MIAAVEERPETHSIRAMTLVRRNAADFQLMMCYVFSRRISSHCQTKRMTDSQATGSTKRAHQRRSVRSRLDCPLNTVDVVHVAPGAILDTRSYPPGVANRKKLSQTITSRKPPMG